METLPVQKRQGLSGTTLKLMACITMLIDHIGASCLEAGLLVPLIASGTFSTDPAAVSLLQMDRVLRYIGRLAFPIFCFLLVEGFLHTHDVKRYVERLFLFGLLSEVPFDMAFFRTPFHWGNQNVYWTLALGVLAMAGSAHLQKENGLPGWQGILCARGLRCAGAGCQYRLQRHRRADHLRLIPHPRRPQAAVPCGRSAVFVRAHRSAGLCAGLVL